jgi:hypothetical protein
MRLLIFFYFDHLPTTIKAATRTNTMGQSRRTTVWARHQLRRFERIMSAPAVTAPIGRFTFW